MISKIKIIAVNFSKTLLVYILIAIILSFFVVIYNFFVGDDKQQVELFYCYFYSSMKDTIYNAYTIDKKNDIERLNSFYCFLEGDNNCINKHISMVGINKVPLFEKVELLKIVNDSIAKVNHRNILFEKEGVGGQSYIKGYILKKYLFKHAPYTELQKHEINSSTSIRH